MFYFSERAVDRPPSNVLGAASLLPESHRSERLGAGREQGDPRDLPLLERPDRSDVHVDRLAHS